MMILYFCTKERLYYLATNKSKTGWVVFGADGNYSVYDFDLKNRYIPDSWRVETIDSIKIPTDLWSDCQDCENIGYWEEDNKIVTCDCLYGMNYKRVI